MRLKGTEVQAAWMTLENEKVEVGVRECSLGVGQALLTVYE